MRSRPQKAAGGFGPPLFRRGERGQSSVEFALCLPLIFLLLLALIQTAFIVRDQVLVTHAAREAARESAVTDAKTAGRHAALKGSGLDPDKLQVSVTGQRRGSRRVDARVTYRTDPRVPIISKLIPSITLRARASMRREGD